MADPTPIRARLFPAHVSVGSQVYDPVLALVGLERIWIYNSVEGGGELVAEFGLDDLKGSIQGGYRADTDAGTVTIVRSRGCGCGSRLTQWNPFPIRQVHVAISR